MGLRQSRQEPALGVLDTYSSLGFVPTALLLLYERTLLLLRSTSVWSGGHFVILQCVHNSEVFMTFHSVFYYWD